MITKKSSGYYIDKYYSSNRPNISGIDDVENFDAYRETWVSGCVEGVKDQDKGISKKNLVVPCSNKFDSSPEVINNKRNYDKLEAAANAARKEEVEQLKKILIIAIPIMIVLLIIIYSI